MRASLDRCFDHSPMKTASEARISQIKAVLNHNAISESDRMDSLHLHTVANSFVQAQQRRNDADYNMAKEWTPLEARTQVDSVREPFESWNVIRESAAGQSYLVPFLVPKIEGQASFEERLRISRE